MLAYGLDALLRISNEGVQRMVEVTGLRFGRSRDVEHRLPVRMPEVELS